jgi:hypothetical protein
MAKLVRARIRMIRQHQQHLSSVGQCTLLWQLSDQIMVLRWMLRQAFWVDYIHRFARVVLTRSSRVWPLPTT